MMRRPVVRLGFQERLHGLRVVAAHGDVGHIGPAIVHGHHGDVFLRSALAAGGKLRHRAQRRGLRHLPAGIGVHLGVEQQDVDVGGGGQHVVEAAVADVVAPSVAADDPHALLDQFVGNRQQVARGRRICFPPASPSAPSPARAARRCLPRWTDRRQNLNRELLADGRSQALDQFLGVFVLLVDGQAHAHAELGVVFEQRVRPGRAAAFGVHACTAWSAGCRRRSTSSRSRWRSARGRRTAGHSRDVRSFAATGAGAGELKQRLQQLRVFHLAVRELLARQLGNRQEVVPVLVVLLAQRRLRLPC